MDYFQLRFSTKATGGFTISGKEKGKLSEIHTIPNNIARMKVKGVS